MYVIRKMRAGFYQSSYFKPVKFQKNKTQIPNNFQNKKTQIPNGSFFKGGQQAVRQFFYKYRPVGQPPMGLFRNSNINIGHCKSEKF